MLVAVSEVPLRELRNHTSEVLRRVEDGHSITVTVSGRPVAQLVPLQWRRQTLTWEEIVATQADPGLLNELRTLLPDTIDDIADPWERHGGGDPDSAG